VQKTLPPMRVQLNWPRSIAVRNVPIPMPVIFAAAFSVWSVGKVMLSLFSLLECEASGSHRSNPFKICSDLMTMTYVPVLSVSFD